MKTLAALAAILLAASAFAAEGEPLRVRAESEVRGESVTLADVVEDAPAGFSKVVLGASPRPGRSVKFGAAWVRSKVAAVVGGPTVEVPEVVTVTRPGRELVREEVEAALFSAIGKKYGDEYEVKIESVTLPPTMNDGELALDVKLPRGRLMTKSTVCVDALIDGKVEGRALARIEARSSSAPQVVVLVKSVKKGAVIRPADVALSDAPAKTGALTEVEAAIGRAATRTLGAGTVVTADQVVTPTLVAKGQTVRLVARVGRITATATGKALGPGTMGEAVSVENSTSGQVVQGIVREAGLVETTATFAEVN